MGLPENFAFMGDDAARLEQAPALADQCSRFLVTMARRYQVVVLGGGYPVPSGDGATTFNRAELVGRDGQLLARYDKIHLFDVDLDGVSYRESTTVTQAASYRLWWMFPVYAGWGCPFATTCASLSSIAISLAPELRC